MNNMFIYRFVDSDLRVKKFVEKDRAEKNGAIDFEIGDIGTSALYWRLKKIL